MNPLILAIQSGSSDVVRILAPIYAAGRYLGYTPLMWGIVIEAPLSEACWRILVQLCAGQTLEAQDGFPLGTTALMLACMKNADNMVVIEMLLDTERGMTNSEN